MNMKDTRGNLPWLIFLIPFFLFSCMKRESGPVVEMNSYDHRDFGTIRVCYLKQPLEIQSWPCKKGKVRYYDNGKLLSCTLDRDHLLRGDSIPPGSRITLFQNGHPKYIRLSAQATIQGYRVAEGSLVSERIISFYGDGKLKEFRPAGNIRVTGVPCSDQRDIELYPGGQLMVCRLNEDYHSDSDFFPAGSMLLFSKCRKAHAYSVDMHAAIHSHFDMEKYLNEKLLRVYELRVTGRSKQALGAVWDLKKAGGFNPMVQYELSRIKRTRYLAGNPDESYESVLNTSQPLVFMERYNLAFCYFDADCASWAGHGKMEEGDSLTARRYFLRAIERFETCLILDPDFHAARLLLVQIYARLSPFLGGDIEKADQHGAILEQAGPVEGTRAASMYLSDPARRLAIWLDLHAKFPDDPDVNHETGRACLFAGDPWKAETYVRQVVEHDSARVLLLLDLARGYLDVKDRTGGVPGEQVLLAEACIKEVLDTEPVQPVKAWCLGQLARCMDMRGKIGEADAYRVKAKQADPLYPRGNRLPPPILYNIPGELPRETYSYLDPF